MPSDVPSKKQPEKVRTTKAEPGSPKAKAIAKIFVGRPRIFLPSIARREEESPSDGIASFPAMVMSQNGQRFYQASMPVEDIFPYCFVTRRIEDPADGFQRTLSDQRADDIAQYLDSARGSIPTNIVLSAQEDAELKYW